MSKETKPRQRSFLVFLLYMALILVILGAGAIVGAYFYFSKDLPKLSKIEDYKPPQMSVVYDADQNKIGEFWTERRIVTPIQEIPDKLKKALIATEDERFYTHHGVDPIGIARAFVTNLKAGHVVEGGSTITQQVAKALVLSPEKTYDRKIKEAILATKIESLLSKDQILFLYLNQTYFGNRAYGVASAANNYFHKELKDINTAEAAMIVGLSKAPSTFNPLVNPTRAHARQQYVIDRMHELGFISDEEANEAKSTVLKIYNAGTDQDFNIRYTPYFTEEVRKILNAKYGKQLYEGGLKIYTTISLEMYQAAQKAVLKGLREVDRRHGFRGPVQHLDEAEIQAWLDQYHITLLNEWGEVDYNEYPNEEDRKKIPTPLSEGSRYQAVIIGGTKAKGFETEVGNVKGLIAPETTQWASGSDRLKRGDIVWVTLYKKEATALSSGKSKNTKYSRTESAPSTETQSASIATEPRLFALDQEPELQSALYSYEPFTGEVKAIIGGQDYRKNEFNRATQALRQPGSAIKPLFYAAALDKGYTPNTPISNEAIIYDDGSGKPWTPKNSGGKTSGPMSLRSALVNSMNLVTVRIVMDVGTHYATAFMRKMGLTSPVEKYYSMALGANDVRVSELARAYGVFATGGILPETYMIRKIVDPSDKVLEEQKPMDKKFIITWSSNKSSGSSVPSTAPEATSSKGVEDKGQAVIPTESQPQAESSPESSESQASSLVKNTEKSKVNKIPWDEMSFNPDLLKEGEVDTQKDQLSLSEYEKKVLYGDYIPKDHVITPRTAATMVSIMQDVVKYGTGKAVLPLKKAVAGKTGTTNGSTDAWFVGYTPTLVTGVWVGHDTKLKSIGHGETGGHVSAPIWLYYMTEATKRYPTKDFKLPPSIDLSQYQTPLEVVQGDTESPDFDGIIPGAAPSKTQQGSGAEFFSNEL